MVQIAKVCGRQPLARWQRIAEDTMKRGLQAKFEDNPHLKQYLLSTGSKRLVEGSPYDGIWGVRVDFNDPKIEDKAYWNGENKLGECLMEVRRQLKS